jgi:hypothetical protein
METDGHLRRHLAEPRDDRLLDGKERAGSEVEQTDFATKSLPPVVTAACRNCVILSPQAKNLVRRNHAGDEARCFAPLSMTRLPHGAVTSPQPARPGLERMRPLISIQHWFQRPNCNGASRREVTGNRDANDEFGRYLIVSYVSTSG